MDLEKLQQAIVDGDIDGAVELAQQMIDQGDDLVIAVEQGFVPGMKKVGDLWADGEYFLPELVQSAEAMKAAMEIINPALGVKRGSVKSKGRIVLGTVEGDLHDIGKSLVGTLLTASGFEVFDLGCNVSVDDFIKKVIEVKGHVIGASALLTTTMILQEKLVAAVQAGSLPVKPFVMIGGAPTSASWAKKIGAHYAENAIDAVTLAQSLVASIEGSYA